MFVHAREKVQFANRCGVQQIVVDAEAYRTILLEANKIFVAQLLIAGSETFYTSIRLLSFAVSCSAVGTDWYKAECTGLASMLSR